ncbi:MAG: hypothetical protein Q7T84_02130 [Phenylobacterium sp.]|uniref:hypothetical protein n=1 Tax=Phenylobacterium sp. TaxID=1871053 RepID=UPI00271CC91D|nr:hypothetical protein [Phenylobacterium sp.]MDO9430078.1 hypothetical protein [Phenylobacterium sp.]
MIQPGRSMPKTLLLILVALMQVALPGAVASAEPATGSLTTQSVAKLLKDYGLHPEGLIMARNADGRRSYGPKVPSDVLNVHVGEASDGTTQFVLIRYVPINDAAANEGARPPVFDVIGRLARLAAPSWNSASDDLFNGSLKAWEVQDQVTIRQEGSVVHLAGSPPDLMYLLIVREGACDLRAVFEETVGCDLVEPPRSAKPLP